MANTMKDGSVEFQALTSTDLEKLFVVAQCVDNQWVPREMLRKMLDNGLGLDDVSDEREKLVRTEYLRALINAQQVVINRSFVYNNSAVFKDFLGKGGDRDAFKELLTRRVIVPCFYKERSPIDLPAYTKDPRGFPAWLELCQEMCVPCLRLSWDDDENNRLTREKLARRLHEFAQVAVARDKELFARELELTADEKAALVGQLGAMARKLVDFAVQDRLVTREELYQAFVVVDGTPPAEGKYDKSKPGARAIKELIDLRYSLNLPDALGGYGLTPMDSLSRVALQEWEEAASQPDITADGLMELLRREVFAIAEQGLSLKSIGVLGLQDVNVVRQMDEWAAYIRSLQGLMDNPLGFANPDGGGAAVYRSYLKLAGAIARHVQKKKQDARVETWAPVIELVVDFAGKLLKVVSSAAGPQYSTAGEIAATASEKLAPVTAKLVIRGIGEIGRGVDFMTSAYFLKRRMSHAGEQFKDLLARLEKTPGFKPALASPQSKTATINLPAEEAA